MYLCQICKASGKTTPVELSGSRGGILDHIVSTGEGGTDEDSNLQTICQCCDKIKTAEESARARGIGMPHPQSNLF